MARSRPWLRSPSGFFRREQGLDLLPVRLFWERAGPGWVTQPVTHSSCLCLHQAGTAAGENAVDGAGSSPGGELLDQALSHSSVCVLGSFPFPLLIVLCTEEPTHQPYRFISNKYFFSPKKFIFIGNISIYFLIFIFWKVYIEGIYISLGIYIYIQKYFL